jgi:hypothetical protein
MYIGGDAKDEGVGAASLIISNNTFAGIPSLMFVELFRDGCSSSWPYDAAFMNNIFSNTNEYGSYSLWNAEIDAYYLPSHDDLAPVFSSNLLWSVSDSLATTTLNSLACAEGGEVESDGKIVSSLFSSTSILSDPLFRSDPTLGTYALDPVSPAVDAGSGLRDPDGTPPDLGAFGGPEGDWWQEVPWQLP